MSGPSYPPDPLRAKASMLAQRADLRLALAEVEAALDRLAADQLYFPNARPASSRKSEAKPVVQR